MDGSDILQPISYETRNLGTTAFALSNSFIESPDPEALATAIATEELSHDRIFVQARIPKAANRTVFLIQPLGFYFVEATVSPQTRLFKNKTLEQFLSDPSTFIPAKYPPESIAVEMMEEVDFETAEIIRAIARSSFIDDRFHIDAKCSNSIADTRFVYWIEDLLTSEETVFYVLNYKDETAGFMARKAENLILAGFSEKYRNSGFGDFLWLSVLAHMRTLAFKKAHTLISTNNVSVLNLYARLGFQFKNPEATLHYWSR